MHNKCTSIVHLTYISIHVHVLRRLSWKKCINKEKKCTKKWTLGTTLKATSVIAWNAQFMFHNCTLYIHFWKSNVHCTVHTMYIKCTSDEAICCMCNVHKKVHQKSAKKYILCTTKIYRSTICMHPKKCTLHVQKCAYTWQYISTFRGETGVFFFFIFSIFFEANFQKEPQSHT